MNEEIKGEFIGQILTLQRRLLAIDSEIMNLSITLGKLIDNLSELDDNERRKRLADLEYIIGKMKGLMK